MCVASGRSAPSHTTRDSPKLSFVSFNLRCPPCKLSTFPPSPLLSHKRRPPGSRRAHASRKAWCPPQAATKQRTFHGGGWKPNQTIKMSEKHSNIKLCRTSQQPALQHLDLYSGFGYGNPKIRCVPDLGPKRACKHSPPLLVNPDSENRSFPIIACKWKTAPGPTDAVPAFRSGVAGVELGVLPTSHSNLN